jgi:preprotein translocase subunit SecE
VNYRRTRGVYRLEVRICSMAKKRNEEVAFDPKKSAKAEKAPKKDAKQSKSASDKKPSVFSRIGGYFHDVRLELKRVVWPTKGEVVNSSIVVVVTLIFFMVFTSLVDAGIIPLLNLFAGLRG